MYNTAFFKLFAVRLLNFYTGYPLVGSSSFLEFINFLMSANGGQAVANETFYMPNMMLL